MLKKIYNHFMQDSLYRNSIYLMASTAVMAGFGFFFWIICARLFTTEQIGLATTLISVMTLISSFSLLGFNTAIVRYLSTSNRKNEKISTSIILISLAALIFSIIYIFIIPIFSPKLFFIRSNILYGSLFILMVVSTTLNSITDSIFLAYRSTIYTLIVNIVMSICKILFPILFITIGAFGVFLSYTTAIFVAMILSFVFLVWKFNYTFFPKIDTNILKEIAKFSFGNYVVNFLTTLPSMFLPIMITNRLGPRVAAYYYMAMMIANLLFIIPSAANQSLFAEGSHSEKELRQHIFKALKITMLILIPSIIIISFLGQYILLVFGKAYSSEALTFLRIISFSGIFLAINGVFASLLRVKRDIKALILFTFIGTCVIILTNYYLLSYGLTGVGIAWILGQLATSLLFILKYISLRPQA